MTNESFLFRNDFRLGQELAVHTRVNPDRRVESLMNFRRRLQTNEAV